MPRVAEERSPAEPTSQEQKARYRRILAAAARHGAAKGLERVQMHDVAGEAGVAIATLYRYFPSKTHLFTALMRSQVHRLAEESAAPELQEAPGEGITRLLVTAGQELIRTPLLAHAMIQSNNAMVAQMPGAAVTEDFIQLMLQAGGIDEPTDHDRRLCRLLNQAWYGIMIAALNQAVTPEELAEDTEFICRLILRERDPH